MPSDRGHFDRILGALSDGSDELMARYEAVKCLNSSSVTMDQVVERAAKKVSPTSIRHVEDLRYIVCTLHPRMLKIPTSGQSSR
jgi:hypothetical protein